MTGEFLSMHGPFLLLCGIALGLVFRSRVPRYEGIRLASHTETGAHAWNDLKWAERDWVDGDAASFSPQLASLYNALNADHANAAQVRAKNPTPVREGAPAARGAWLKL